MWAVRGWLVAAIRANPGLLGFSARGWSRMMEVNRLLEVVGAADRGCLVVEGLDRGVIAGG